MIAAAALAFLLSGAAGLMFELVWFDRASLVLGNSVIAAAVVLSAFMGGLALGNAAAARIALRARRLLIVYAALEATIAATGVALTYALAWLAPRALPAGAAFVLLLVPATAMGATLPIFVAALRPRLRRRFGTVLGALYGWNTLGAVAGALLAETVLIAAFGLSGTAWAAGALDAVAGAIALTLARRAVDETGVPATDGFADPRAAPTLRPLLAGCAFLSGLALLALEVLWFRFLSSFVLTTTLVMTAMLAVVLAGIAIGGFAAARWVARHDPADGAAAVALASAVTVGASYAAFALVTSGTQIAALPAVLWLAVVLTLPTSFASGALFTLLGQAVRATERDDVRAAALLTCANTAGATCGAPVAAFLLLPRLGTERAFAAIVVVYIAVAALVWIARLRPSARSPRVATACLGAAAAIALVRFPFGLMTATYHARIAAAYDADGSQIVAAREGPSESILVLQQQWMNQPVYSRLVTNGFSMSGTAIPGQRYMRYFVYWPMLVHETPLQRILVICYGAGVTASAATDVPSAIAIDVVELSREVVAASDTIYAGDRHPLRDPRVRLHIDDGRHFLQTTDRRFDLITGEPPPPRTPGAVHIYTREYFELVRDRLADGGMTTYWLPVARPNPGTDVDTIVRAFCDVFDNCSLWNATPFDLMLVGSRGRPGRFDPTRFAAVRERLSDIGFELPEQIGATFVGDAAFLRELTARTPPVTDDFPQRLRPVAARPSLSDPRYPRDLAVVAEYQRVLSTDRARAAFARSADIRARWPAPLLAATLPWFDQQAAINRVLWEGGNPLRLVEDFDRALTQTPLRTLPLWMLGGDAVKSRIAATGNDGTGQVEYFRGAQLLANRDYAAAAAYFGLAEKRGLRSTALRPLIAYALCRANRRDLSQQIVASFHPPDADARHFVGWMQQNCRP